MTNKGKLIQSLLEGAQANNYSVQASALIAIGNSGLINETSLVTALLNGANANNYDVAQAAYTGMGLMLKNSNRQ